MMLMTTPSVTVRSPEIRVDLPSRWTPMSSVEAWIGAYDHDSTGPVVPNVMVTVDRVDASLTLDELSDAVLHNLADTMGASVVDATVSAGDLQRVLAMHAGDTNVTHLHRHVLIASATGGAGWFVQIQATCASDAPSSTLLAIRACVESAVVTP
jgi:hypothetical protein